MPRILLLIAALISATASAQEPRDGRPAGYVAAVAGDARALVGPGEAGRAVQTGDAVHVGDRFATGAGGALRVVLYDESVIALGHDAAAAIDAFAFDRVTGRGRVGVELQQGGLTLTPGRIGAADPANVALRMPSGAVVAAGAAFAARVDGMRALVAMLEPGHSLVVGGPRIAVVGGDATAPPIVLREAGAAVELGWRGPAAMARLDPVRAQRLLSAMPAAVPELAALAGGGAPVTTGIVNRVLDRLGVAGDLIRDFLGLSEPLPPAPADAAAEPSVSSAQSVARAPASTPAAPSGGADEPAPAAVPGEAPAADHDASTGADALGAREPLSPWAFVQEIAVIAGAGIVLAAIGATIVTRVAGFVVGARKRRQKGRDGREPAAAPAVATGSTSSSAGGAPMRRAPAGGRPMAAKLAPQLKVTRPDGPPRVTILSRNAPPRYVPLTADPTFGPKLRRGR